MVYPQLHISSSNELSVHLIDTEIPDSENPIMTMGDTGEGTGEAFITLLTAFMNQYKYGYEEGFDDAMECFDEGEEK